MKQVAIYFFLPLLVLSGCTTSSHSTSGNDDVYGKRSATYYRETAPEPASAPTYRNEAPTSTYQDYEEENDYRYNSYSSRLRRFHGSYTSDYYSPMYSSPFSWGFSMGSYGSSAFLFGSPWNSYGYPRSGNYNWYDFHIYNYHTPLWNSWGYSSWYSPWYSPWGYNNWGWNSWNSWNPGRPWYYENNYYHQPNTNVNRYYGPRNWSGSNTPSGNGGIIEREAPPAYNYTPGNNSNYGNYTTPSGIDIEKGSKTVTPKIEYQTPATTPPADPDPGLHYKPKNNVKYYSPNNQERPAYSPSAPSQNPAPAPTPQKGNQPGIKVNKGVKTE